MRQIITTALCVFLFAVLAQAAAYGEAKVITIGGIVTLSGEGAPYGINAQRGAILAIEEINSASHGIPFKVIWEDEIGGKAEKAVTAYKKLTQIDGVSIIFGPTYLDGLFAIAPLAKKDGKLLVTASNPALSISNVFSTWVDPRQEAETMAKHIASSHKRVAVLSCQQAWDAIVGKHFRDSFTATGGEIVYLTEPLPDTTDLKPEVLKAKLSKPDAIFISSYTLFSKYTRELKRMRVSVPLYGIEVDKSVIDAASGTAEGLEFIAPSMPKAGDFISKFEKRFGVVPDVPAFQAYDAMFLLAKAVEMKGTSIPDLLNYFGSFDHFEGVSGTLRTENGQVQFPLDFFRVKDGRYDKID